MYEKFILSLQIQSLFRDNSVSFSSLGKYKNVSFQPPDSPGPGSHMLIGHCMEVTRGLVPHRLVLWPSPILPSF